MAESGKVPANTRLLQRMEFIYDLYTIAYTSWSKSHRHVIDVTILRYESFYIAPPATALYPAHTEQKKSVFVLQVFNL